MIKAVIFDMDGVIVDSEPLESQTLEKLLKKYGKTPIRNRSGLIHIAGTAGDEYWKPIMKKYKLSEKIEILRSKRLEIFVDIVKKGMVPIPSVLTLIKKLKKANIKLALASNRFLDQVFLIIGMLKMKDYFDVIVGATKMMRRKPFPDIYLKSARVLRISPVFCVALEDSETGVLSAKAAGMKVIAIPNKYTKHHDFSKADKIVSRLSEITIPMLKNL